MQIARRSLVPGETDHELIWLSVSLGGLACAATWFALHLPWPICVFHALTGHPCGTCGATRSAIAFFHGHLLSAFAWNPLAFAGYCALSIFDAYAFVILITRGPRVRFTNWTVSEKIFARYSLLALFAMNWIYLLIANPAL